MCVLRSDRVLDGACDFELCVVTHCVAKSETTWHPAVCAKAKQRTMTRFDGGGAMLESSGVGGRWRTPPSRAGECRESGRMHALPGSEAAAGIAGFAAFAAFRCFQ